MIERKIEICILIMLCLSINQCNLNNKADLVVIHLENGWGYELNNHGKTIIHQEIIPVIEGSSPFLSRKDSRKTGKLALHKLNEGKIPVITSQELDSLGIVYPL